MPAGGARPRNLATCLVFDNERSVNGPGAHPQDGRRRLTAIAEDPKAVRGVPEQVPSDGDTYEWGRYRKDEDIV